MAIAYTEYLEQYGLNDIHYWSSRLLAKRLTKDELRDDHSNEDEVGQAQILGEVQPQVYNNAKTPEPCQLPRGRLHRDDESDEENLRSLIPESKRVKLESVGNPTALQVKQSSYRGVEVKAEEVESVSNPQR